MDNTLVMDTLNEVIRKQKDVHGVILHSDQGFQYASNEYKAGGYVHLIIQIMDILLLSFLKK